MRCYRNDAIFVGLKYSSLNLFCVFNQFVSSLSAENLPFSFFSRFCSTFTIELIGRIDLNAIVDETS